MSDWSAYLKKTANLSETAGKAYKAIKPVVGKGLSTVAEGAALGVGIGATEYVMNKKMQAMEKQLKAMEREREKTSGVSYENAFQRLMAYLRALYELHQWMHWRTKGQTFYGDHQLFQRLYEKVAEELDGLAEKAIGLSNNVDVVDPKGSANAAADILEDFQFTPEGALAAERGFIGLVKQVSDDLGENLTDGLDNFLQGLSDTHEGHVYLLQQRVTPGVKTASMLDRSLGLLYQKYGPPLEKHAAAAFYGTLDKARLDREALGPQFCKLASASGLDPWKMAGQVLSNFPKLAKLAQYRGPSREGELAQFYVEWAGDIIKKAGLFDATIRAGRALKAGIGAAVPRSSKSLMNDALHAARSGAELPGPRKGVFGSIKDSLAHTKALQEAGGGSLRRGEALVKEDPHLLHVGNPSVPAPHVAPHVAPPEEGSGYGDLARGALVLGGLGLGGSMLLGGHGDSSNAQQQPGYGVAYA